MKKVFVVLLAIAFLAINVASNNGKRVIGIHPIAFLSAVNEDLPEGIDIFKNFSDYYADGENTTLGDKVVWLFKTTLDSLSFPITGTVWIFQAIKAFWSNFHVLFEFAGHGDLDDPNYAGGR